MKQQFQTFKELTDTAKAYLKSLSYGSSSIDSYSREWLRISNYMQVNEIRYYDSSTGEKYLDLTVGSLEQKTLSRKQRSQIRAVSVLSDFVTAGIIRKRKKTQTSRKLDGPIGELMSGYILKSKQSIDLAASTVQSYYLYLSVFLSYLDSCGITSIEHLGKSSIMDFVGYLREYSVVTRYLIISRTNQFLKYLYDKQVLPVDYSRIMPKVKYVRQPKLPSYYSQEEVGQLVNCIDRANPIGKRDYAMILLVARLGLRCSDIANLKFSNIQWEQEQILLIQQKTKELLALPLLSEVGNAIIDYLKYGRPQSNLTYIFLRHIPPYENMCNNLLYGIMQKYLNLSGIRYDERRHGPHALRHSLATNLLKKEVSLLVISGILGHTCSKSTMSYLRVDINSLRKCALEVPVISQYDRKEVVL